MKILAVSDPGEMLLLSQKICTQCGELKPLSKFYRSAAAKDRHTAECAACTRARVDASKAWSREHLGEAEYLFRQRETVRRSRASGGADYRPTKARGLALLELGRRHPKELAALVRLERVRLGLDPTPQSQI